MNEAAQILDKVPTPPPQENMGEGQTTDGAPQPAKVDDKVSGKFEALIKREQQALARERQAKAIEAQIEARERSIQEREKKIQEFEGAKGNSKKALELLGLNYDELTKSMLQDGEIPPEVHIKKIEEKFDAFRSAKEQEDKDRAEEAKRQAEAQEVKAINDFKTEINTYLSDNSARYELVGFENQQELVFSVIDENYNRTLDPETGIGKVMSIKEAADKVEEYLEQKYNKAKELNKTKALWGAVPKEAIKQAAKPEIKSNTPPRTLTNQLSATATRAQEKPHVITDEERVQKAIAYAKGLRP